MNLVPVVSVRVEMRAAERVELLDDSLLVFSLSLAGLGSVGSRLLCRPFTV